MALITWDTSLSVEVGEIDTQHQKLIKLINDLNEAMKIGKAKDAMANIIHGLVDYTRSHFSREEKYFDQFGFSGAALHKQEHKKFVGKISEFEKGFGEGKLMLSMDVMNFLKDWLVDHIKGTDKKYSKCFNENGLK